MRIASRSRSVVSALAAVTLASVGLFAVASTPPAHAAGVPVSLAFLGRYSSGVPDGGSEITAFDPVTRRMFVTNGASDAIDIVDVSNPSVPTLVPPHVDLGRPLQSVAVKNGLVAVALEGEAPANPALTGRQQPGEIVVLDTNGVEQWRVTVGALPDMVTFTPDGSKVLSANEGEPLNYCAPPAGASATDVDPEGSVSIVDVATHAVTTVSFGAFTDADALRAQGIRIFGPNATPAQDLEPEYIAIRPDGAKAYVTLQENNALAVIDIATGLVEQLVPLGYQHHDAVRIDTSDRELPGNLPQINVIARSANVLGMFLPDAIDSFESGGATYLALANEGDAREYDCFGGPDDREDLRVSQQGNLDDATFAAEEDSTAGLRRLRASSVFPLTAADTSATGLKKVYSYGGRSFTIRDLDGNIVWDSGSELEDRTAALLPSAFNGEWNEDDGGFDGFDLRSPNKGPEPEAIEIGAAYGRTFAFVGLERTGGVMVYDVTDPRSPSFVEYLNTSDFSGNYKAGNAGDVAPEGILFVPAGDSPTGRPLVIVSFELSGTTSIFELNGPPTVSAAADVSVSEAAGSQAINVTLSEDSTETVTVGYRLAPGTATEGDDYAALSGTLAFAPGETTKPVNVAIVGDALDEPAETLSLVLSNPSNGILGDAETVITVDDDDPPALSIGDASVTEGIAGCSACSSRSRSHRRQNATSSCSRSRRPVPPSCSSTSFPISTSCCSGAATSRRR